MAKDCPRTDKGSGARNKDEDDEGGVSRDRIVKSNEKDSDNERDNEGGYCTSEGGMVHRSTIRVRITNIITHSVSLP